MVYFLYYREEGRFDDTHAWIDRWCGLYGMHPIVIDKERGKPDGTKNGFTYDSLDSALKNDRYKKHNWVWTDIRSEKFLDEYEHPHDNVIYCIGSDYDGYGRDVLKLPGDKIKIRLKKEEVETYAGMVAPMIFYDRFLFMEGRRK